MHSPLSNAVWAVLPGRTQFVILVHCCMPRTLFPFLALTTCALSSFSVERHWAEYGTGVALLSGAFLPVSVFPLPWPKTHSQPRTRSVFPASEGCNLLETSAMTLLLLLNSWLACGVTWARATNLAEPQTLKGTPPTEVTMICFTVLSLRSLNFGLSLRWRIQGDHINIQPTFQHKLYII